MNVRIFAAAGLVLASLTLGACGSSGKAAAKARAATTAAAGAGTSSGSATSSGGSNAGSAAAKTIDICSLLDASTAARLSGQPYTTATRENGDWTASCAYNNDDSTAQGVNPNVDNQKADSTWRIVHTGNVTDISGLGDKAFWDNDNTLYAQSGSVLIQVNGLDSKDKSQALGKALLDALH